MSDQNRQIGYYKRLPYTRSVDVREEDGETYFLAEIEELDGVEASGATRWEALHNLEAAFDSYLRAMTELGREIPTPDSWPETYPGEYREELLKGEPEPQATGDQHDWPEEIREPEFPAPGEEKMRATA